MTKAAVKTIPPAAAESVAQALQHVLKDTYGLYFLTHNYHWNVEGPRFAELHVLFEQQYTELFGAVDTIAEHIRTLGVYALPGHYEEILLHAKDIPNPLNKEEGADAVADWMVSNLASLHESLIQCAQKAKRAAQEAQDDESVDLMVERIRVHQKAAWMLKSIIK